MDMTVSNLKAAVASAPQVATSLDGVMIRRRGATRYEIEGDSLDDTQRLVRAQVEEDHAAGRLYFTTLLATAEPFRTMGLLRVDGMISVAGGVQTRQGEALNVPPVRIIHTAEVPREAPKDRVLRAKVLIKRRIPGTDIITYGWEWETFGTDAALPWKTALQILRRVGWPSLQRSTKGRVHGSAVEWEWLCDEAAKPGAMPELVDLHHRLAARLATEAKAATPAVAKR